MKTPDLIAALAADRQRHPPVAKMLAAALIGAGAVSIAIYAIAIGPRPDLMAMLATPRVLFKLSWTAALALAASAAFLRFAAPGRRIAGTLVALAGVFAALGLAVGVELSVLPPDLWATRAHGHNATWCLRLIPVLSLAPLIAALFVLRRAAPTRPAWAGAAAGLLAGALGAVLYATHCPDDSPLFVASWYGIAILGMTLLGSGLGARFLRW